MSPRTVAACGLALATGLLVDPAEASPGACDPSRDQAGSSAVGYCLTEAEYLELGRLRQVEVDLRSKVAADGAEIQAFESWKAEREGELEKAVSGLTDASAQALLLERRACETSLVEARKRTLVEQHGFAVGLVLGIAGTVALTSVVLDVYGSVLGS